MEQATLQQIVKDPNQVTISDIVRVYARDREDIKTMQRSQRRDLEGWKHYFLEHTKRMEKSGLREGEEMRRYITVESLENCSPLQTKKYGLSRDRSKIADP